MSRIRRKASCETGDRFEGPLLTATEGETVTGTVARAEHRELANRSRSRSLPTSPTSDNSRPNLPSLPQLRQATPPSSDERRRLERDLHDGVQTELVALIVQLSLAREDPNIPPTLAGTLAALEARAQAALDTVRHIARGICPPLLADFGLDKALRTQAARTPIKLSLLGAAPRSTDEAEAAAYFSCSEAIQNAVKHAGQATRVTVELRHHRGTLAIDVRDDGRGFDPERAPRGAGLDNIRDRIETLGGSLIITSSPGRGTVLTISVPWPAQHRAASQIGDLSN